MVDQSLIKKLKLIEQNYLKKLNIEEIKKYKNLLNQYNVETKHTVLDGLVMELSFCLQEGYVVNKDRISKLKTLINNKK